MITDCLPSESVASRQAVALPLPTGEDDGGSNDPLFGDPNSLAALSRQGRILLRLCASTEALAQKTDALAEKTETLDARTQNLVSTAQKASRAAQAEANDQLIRMAHEAIFLMDVLQNAHEAAHAGKNETLARELATALRSGARRLASQGVCEIPCPVGEPPDGLLHESIRTADGARQKIPRYGIVGIQRRGWQMGTQILRRAQVVTAR